MLKAIPQIFVSFYRAGVQFHLHKGLRLSAALSFYSIFSIGPLLIIALAVSGFVFGDEAVRGQLEYQLQDLMGSKSAEMVEELVASYAQRSQRSSMAAVGLAILVFGATGVFGQLKDALNTIWEVKPVPDRFLMTFLKKRLLSFSMVLVVGFLLLVSMLLTTVLQAFSSAVGELLPLSPVVWQGASAVVSFVVVALLFASIFKILPDVETRWADVWLGALVTAALFAVGKFVIGFYLGREETASAYGAASALVMVLIWVYFASTILLYGAEFTKVRALIHRGGKAPAVEKIAEPLGRDEREKQGIDSKS
jgi:membrane protein